MSWTTHSLLSCAAKQFPMAMYFGLAKIFQCHWNWRLEQVILNWCRRLYSFGLISWPRNPGDCLESQCHQPKNQYRMPRLHPTCERGLAWYLRKYQLIKLPQSGSLGCNHPMHFPFLEYWTPRRRVTSALTETKSLPKSWLPWFPKPKQRVPLLTLVGKGLFCKS